MNWWRFWAEVLEFGPTCPMTTYDAIIDIIVPCDEMWMQHPAANDNLEK